MSPSLYRPVDDWLDGSLTGIIAVSALIAVIIAAVLASLAIMTVRRTNMTRKPGPAPRPSEHHPGSTGASTENPKDG